MSSQMKILDDLAQMAGGAVGLMNNIQQQIKNDVQERIDAQLHKMNLVARDDFDRLEAQLSKALARIDALEKQLNTKKSK